MEKNDKKVKKVKFKATIFAVSNSQQKKKKDDRPIETNPEMKTLLEIINDTDTGIPMKDKSTSKTNLDNLKEGADKRKSSNYTERTVSLYGSNLSHSKGEQEKEKAKAQNTLLNRKVSTTSEGEDFTKYFKPRVIIGEDGKMQIERPDIALAATKIKEDINKSNLSIVDYDTPDPKVTSLSFRKNSHVDKWNEQETTLFYRALECFGTDFTLLESILQPRKRREIKNKYRKEEKENPERVDMALKRKDQTKLHKMVAIASKMIKEEENNKTEKEKKKSSDEDNTVDEDKYKKILMDEYLDIPNEEMSKINEEIAEESQEDAEDTVSYNNNIEEKNQSETKEKKDATELTKEKDNILTNILKNFGSE